MTSSSKPVVTPLFWSRHFHFLNQLINLPQAFYAGLLKYSSEFLVPAILSSSYFIQQEAQKLHKVSLLDNLLDYQKLAEFNGDLATRSWDGAFSALNHWQQDALKRYIEAFYQGVSNHDQEALVNVVDQQLKLFDMVALQYPKAIEAVGSEFGFHFERGVHKLMAETDRFLLYRVSPVDPQIEVKKGAKPVLILPPYVLGADILGFLPAEKRSYAHCFANSGIPTYIRVMKDISVTPALQTMTGEDDALDTRKFCKIIKKEHGRAVTLNGYCQGGFAGLCNLLSGRLDNLVDAFITCVAPIDGTRSKGLADFLKALPKRFNNLDYGTKKLPNGNRVADGKLMGWVYKLKSIETEGPVSAFLRDLIMFQKLGPDAAKKVSKTALALNYWLLHERSDLPLEITKMSFASFNTPITADGVLPITLFGQKLSLKRFESMNIPWLICYGEKDDLVEKEAALAASDYIDVEITPFPKGHVAMATSWSDPNSACALHTRFGDGNWRGPVRFHLDLDA